MDLDVFVAIDVESSGFGKDAQVLEVGIAHFWKGKVVRRWSSLICPMGLSFTDEKVAAALAINKIPIESLMYSALTFKKTCARIEMELGEPLWVAHCADFDKRMLLQEYQRMGMDDLPVKPDLFVCTKELDLLINPGERGHKLDDLVRRWGTPGGGTHRALDDAEACGHIFAAMLEKVSLPGERFKEFYDRKQTLQWYKTMHGL